LTPPHQPRRVAGDHATPRALPAHHYRQGADRLIGEPAAYLRRAHDAGAQTAMSPRLEADPLLARFLGDGHIRRLPMLGMPEAREAMALLREAVSVFMAAYEVAG